MKFYDQFNDRLIEIFETSKHSSICEECRRSIQRREPAVSVKGPGNEVEKIYCTDCAAQKEP
jgi:hypothetical protein